MKSPNTPGAYGGLFFSFFFFWGGGEGLVHKCIMVFPGAVCICWFERLIAVVLYRGIEGRKTHVLLLLGQVRGIVSLAIPSKVLIGQSVSVYFHTRSRLEKVASSFKLLKAGQSSPTDHRKS